MAEVNLLDDQTILTILSEIDNGEERERKRQAFDAYQVFSGNLKTYVLEELQRTRSKSWESYSVSNISVSKMVTKKLSKSYNNDPVRVVVDSSGEASEEKTESIHEWYNEAESQRQLKEMDQIVNLHKHGLLWVNWRQQEERWQFVALAPYEFSVVRNKDTGAVEIVILKYPTTDITSGGNSGRFGVAQGDGRANLIAESQVDSGGQTQVYAMWSATQHVVVELSNDEITLDDGTTTTKRSITYVKIPDNPESVNPLGIIPFIYVTKDNSPDFPTTNPITEQTVTFNALWSELLTAANVQGTSIFTLSYPESQQGNMESQTHGITTGIELPQKEDSDIRTEANFISPSPDLANQKEVYTNYLRMILAEHGITNSQGLDGNSSEMHPSALDRIIANADVQGQISQNQMCLYEPMEMEMFKIMKAWLSKVLKNTTISEEDELVIKYPKPRILISDKETLENIEKRLNMGLMEQWEALVAIDPNLSEKEARNKIEQINETRMAVFEDNQENEPRPVENKEQE